MFDYYNARIIDYFDIEDYLTEKYKDSYLDISDILHRDNVCNDSSYRYGKVYDKSEYKNHSEWENILNDEFLKTGFFIGDTIIIDVCW